MNFEPRAILLDRSPLGIALASFTASPGGMYG
jgi:hypothetical protein